LRLAEEECVLPDFPVEGDETFVVQAQTLGHIVAFLAPQVGEVEHVPDPVAEDPILVPDAIGKPTSCDQNVCTWKNVSLAPGDNRITVTGTFGSKRIADSVTWTLQDRSGAVCIAVGAIGPVTGAYGERYGSDALLTELSYATSFGVGNKKALSLEEAVAVASTLPKFAPVMKKAFKFNEPNPQVPQLFRSWREGNFAYEIPLRNGKYYVRLSFFEPDSKAIAGTRKFDVVINGAVVDSRLDVFEAAGGDMKAVVREYPMQVKTDKAKLEFKPLVGKALLSAIEILPAW
jgi:beta-galactosidase